MFKLHLKIILESLEIYLKLNSEIMRWNQNSPFFHHRASGKTLHFASDDDKCACEKKYFKQSFGYR